MEQITRLKLHKPYQKSTYPFLDTNYNSDENNESGFGIGAAIATAIGQISTALPQLGIGKKSRMEEADNAAENAQNNARLLIEAKDQESDNMKKLVLIVGVLIFVTVIAAVALRK
jgi:hypothetical protein